MEIKEKNDPICKDIPSLLSSFVDTFVDFSVSDGIFLPSVDLQNEQTNGEYNDIRTWYPTPNRLVAIGDLHGDLEKSKQAFRLAGLIDGSDRWSGGSATVVQIGDVLDRGGEELKILYFLEKLKREAVKSGGNLITMNGNHEIMNVESDFRYVTKVGLEEFSNWAYWYSLGNKMKSLCVGLENPKDIFDGIPLTFRGVKQEYVHGIRARIAALRPDGPIANKFLSKNVTVLVIGDSVFVHGGLLAKHVEYGLERMNQEVRDWITGLAQKSAPGYCRGREAVVWLRKFSDEVAKNCDCSALEHVLATIPGVKRMIMGHTIQEAGINAVCDNRAIRIDVGMSKGCINGLPEVLEINGKSELRVLTSNPWYESKQKSFLDSERKEGLGLLIPENGPKQVEVKA
ncbi:shewanella-like protein phosphatase 2 [Ricinus communis]|uniref:shewanella-like protein phosphatase 2 n=1 Tax=Ricinus communis TaxID=3988 RepID=UPI00201A7D19|nr:shewanella-like protein phosphatase 2 [Ricinus communis]